MKLIYLLIIALSILIPCFFTKADPIILTNKSISKNQRTLSQFELLQIFIRKQLFWSDGTKITVFIKPVNSIEHKLFLMTVLNITEYKYKSMLDSVVYSGGNNPPIEVSSDEEMLFRLKNTPNSIGYINYSIYINDSDKLVPIKVM